MKDVITINTGGTLIGYKKILIIFLLTGVLGLVIIFLFFKPIINNNTLQPYEGYKQFTPNYYFGVDVDMSQLLPSSKNYIKNSKGEDLTDIAAGLGINTFRIMNNSSESRYSYTKQQWDIVLRKMNSKGIKAIILNESPLGTYPKTKTTISIEQKSLNHLDDYILSPEVCNNPDVFAIDISNEPDLNADHLTRLQKEAQMVKQKCPNTKVTIGGWKVEKRKDKYGNITYDWNNPQNATLIENIVDIYAPHIYGFDRKRFTGYPNPYILTTNYLKTLKQFGGNKPILIEEFGAGNGQAFTDQGTLGSKELQANVYQGVLQATEDEHIMGATSYLFYPRSSHPEGWTILSDNGNTIFPAADVFQEFTNQSTTSNNSLPFKTVPRNVRISTKDNNQTVSVNIGDIIGIHLFESSKNNYTMQTNNNILQVTEPLSKGWKIGYYDTVFQTIKSGVEKISILENNNSYFTVTIQVN